MILKTPKIAKILLYYNTWLFYRSFTTIYICFLYLSIEFLITYPGGCYSSEADRNVGKHDLYFLQRQWWASRGNRKWTGQIQMIPGIFRILNEKKQAIIFP